MAVSKEHLPAAIGLIPESFLLQNEMKTPALYSAGENDDMNVLKLEVQYNEELHKKESVTYR